MLTLGMAVEWRLVRRQKVYEASVRHTHKKIYKSAQLTGILKQQQQQQERKKKERVYRFILGQGNNIMYE